MRKAKGGEGRNLSSLSFHSLRHACATVHAAQGVPEELRMVHLGHSTKAAHKIYTHREVEQLRQIADAAPNVLSSPAVKKCENSDDDSEISWIMRV